MCPAEIGEMYILWRASRLLKTYLALKTKLRLQLMVLYVAVVTYKHDLVCVYTALYMRLCIIGSQPNIFKH